MSQITNVEIKAKCHNLELLHNKLISMGARDLGVDHQVDTYFKCQNGRLKLRRGNIENSLIFYQRENMTGARESQIQLDKLSADNNVKSVLSAAYGVKVEVDKRRNIYFIENVKFHLDRVEGLGSFMEIEAIDSEGTIGVEKLDEQCHFFMQSLGVSHYDLVELSYSDLLLESFEARVVREAHVFYANLVEELTELKVHHSGLFMDHLCYRTETEQDYQSICEKFAEIGELLVESEVGGRLISSFKLFRPIQLGKRSLSVIEVPAPKAGVNYSLGFEHAEFVLEESFSSFMNKHPSCDFNKSGLDKAFNAELRLSFDSGRCVKFHEQSLEDVIEKEKAPSK